MPLRTTQKVSKPFSDKEKAKIYARDRATWCFSGANLWLLDAPLRCGWQSDWVDHVKPRSRGGSAGLKNGVFASHTFNSKKRNNTANTAKQQLGQVLDTALTAPVSITKHGRPTFVLTSKEGYDSLTQLKFEHFKREVQIGFDSLDRGEFSARTFEEIAEEVVAAFKQG
jgi:prevent-host-death family protein